MPRFVLLHHELSASHPRASHYDLMLETEGVLRTWALAQRPVADLLIAAEALADHRLAYLDYEGAISHDRGRVARIDRGSYQATFDSDAVSGELSGERFRGSFQLRRKRENTWLFTWNPHAT
jgi:hypothetical protein